MFGNIYGVHPSGTSIQRSGSPRGTFLRASANLIRNRGIHIDYPAHAHPIIARWLDLAERSKHDPTLPRVLPIVEIGRKHYFVDERLRQLRNVKDPHDFVNW